nr:MAG TPA: hypothetical protein [Caudoviricetes sp.]
MHIMFQHRFLKPLSADAFMSFFNIGGNDMRMKTFHSPHCRNEREVKITLLSTLLDNVGSIVTTTFDKRLQCFALAHPDYEGVKSYFSLDMDARTICIDMRGDEEEVRELWFDFWERMGLSKVTLEKVMEVRFEVHNGERNSFTVGNPWRDYSRDE